MGYHSNRHAGQSRDIVVQARQGTVDDGMGNTHQLNIENEREEKPGDFTIVRRCSITIRSRKQLAQFGCVSGLKIVAQTITVTKSVGAEAGCGSRSLAGNEGRCGDHRS